jgi:CRP-like cAMP-binding protein
VETIKQALLESAPFKRLTEEELHQVLALCRQHAYSEGDIVFSEGTSAEDLYIITDGMIVVEMKLAVYPGWVQKAMVEVLRHGDAFGWSSVLGSHVYTMTAKTMEPSKVITIDGTYLHRLLDQQPDIGYKVMLGLVEVASSRVWGVKRAVFA